MFVWSVWACSALSRSVCVIWWSGGSLVPISMEGVILGVCDGGLRVETEVWVVRFRSPDLGVFRFVLLRVGGVGVFVGVMILLNSLSSTWIFFLSIDVLICKSSFHLTVYF